MATGSGKTITGRQLLTAKGIEAMEPDPSGRYRVPDTRGQGLPLRVAAWMEARRGIFTTGSKHVRQLAFSWARL